MKYWKDDEEDAAVVVDLVKDIESAQEMHLSWKNNETGEMDQGLSGAKKAQIILTNLLSSLEKSPDREILHHFSFYGVDATPKEQATESLDFVVRAAVSGKPTIGELIFKPIVEGNQMEESVSTWVSVDSKVDYSEFVLTIGEQQYSLLQEEVRTSLSDLHVEVEQEESRQYKVTFNTSFGSNWKVGSYPIELYVKDSDANEERISGHLDVKDPNVQLLSTDGDAFAKRIVLRASMENEAQKEKLRFEYSTDGSSWQPISNSNNFKLDPDNTHWVDTLTGLNPETTYKVRAVYQSMEQIEHVSEKSLMTETENKVIPNSGFEHWYSEKTDKDGIPITKNVNKVFWDKWFPWNQSDLSTKAWNTVNQITTQDGASPTLLWPTDTPTPPYVGCCYVANSGTIPTKDAEGTAQSAALIRTVGWGSGSTAGGSWSIIKRLTPGELYLGDCVNLEPIYGIDFSSRPTGFSFDYKYETKSGSDDKFVAEVIVYASDGSIVATAQLPEGSCGANASWSKAEVRLNYTWNTGRNKAAKLCIRFKSSSSTEKNYLEANLMKYPPLANLSDGESVGSQLYIDNVELIYE